MVKKFTQNRFVGCVLLFISISYLNLQQIYGGMTPIWALITAFFITIGLYLLINGD